MDGICKDQRERHVSDSLAEAVLCKGRGRWMNDRLHMEGIIITLVAKKQAAGVVRPEQSLNFEGLTVII